MELKIKKLDTAAKIPVRSHSDDAGIDLFSNEDVEIMSGDYHPVKTGIAMQIPAGHVGLVWDKSGIANKGIKTVGGVVDAGYRGEVMVQLRNFGPNAYKIEIGDKVAQMLIQKVEFPLITEADELNDTARGDGKFGSTGIK